MGKGSTKNPEKKSQEAILLEKLLEQEKEESDFNRRYSYVMFCLTIASMVIGFFAVIYTIREIPDDSSEQLTLLVVTAATLIALFIIMMRNPGWGSNKKSDDDSPTN